MYHLPLTSRNELDNHAHGLKLAPGLELVDKTKWYTHFCSDIPVGNFGLPLKTFRSLWRISGRANLASLTIYIPTEIFGYMFVEMVNSQCSLIYKATADMVEYTKTMQREIIAI